MSECVWVVLNETFGNVKKSEQLVFRDRETALEVMDQKLIDYEQQGKVIRKRRNSNSTKWVIGDDMLLTCYPAVEIEN